MKKSDYENALIKGHYELLWHDLLSASGFAGCLPNGNIVDRRYFNEAIPIKKNTLLGVAEPKVQANMATKKEQEIADGIIKTLKDHGYSYDEMIPIIHLAKEKFKALKQK